MNEDKFDMDDMWKMYMTFCKKYWIYQGLLGSVMTLSWVLTILYGICYFHRSWLHWTNCLDTVELILIVVFMTVTLILDALHEGPYEDVDDD